MTSNPGMNVNSVLPLNARTARIAAGGGIAACAHEFPACGNAAASGRRTGGAIRTRLRPVVPSEQDPNTTIHHN